MKPYVGFIGCSLVKDEYCIVAFIFAHINSIILLGKNSRIVTNFIMDINIIIIRIIHLGKSLQILTNFIMAINAWNNYDQYELAFVLLL